MTTSARLEVILIVEKHASKNKHNPIEGILDTPVLFFQLNASRSVQGKPPLSQSGFRRLINRLLSNREGWTRLDVRRALGRQVKLYGRKRWGFQVAVGALSNSVAKRVEDVPPERDFTECELYYRGMEFMKYLGHCNTNIIHVRHQEPLQIALEMAERVRLMHHWYPEKMAFACYPVDFLHLRKPALFCNEHFVELFGDESKSFQFKMTPELAPALYESIVQCKVAEFCSYPVFQLPGTSFSVESRGLSYAGLYFVWMFVVERPHTELDSRFLTADYHTCVPAVRTGSASREPLLETPPLVLPENEPPAVCDTVTTSHQDDMSTDHDVLELLCAGDDTNGLMETHVCLMAEEGLRDNRADSLVNGVRNNGFEEEGWRTNRDKSLTSNSGGEFEEEGWRTNRDKSLTSNSGGDFEDETTKSSLLSMWEQRHLD